MISQFRLMGGKPRRLNIKYCDGCGADEFAHRVCAPLPGPKRYGPWGETEFDLYMCEDCFSRFPA